MCLVAFSFGVSKNYPLLFATNRDELHTRPTSRSKWWKDHDHILGGRDLLAHGTWLAIDQSGRLAAVTNMPSNSEITFKKSRGHLVRDYLISKLSADQFVSTLNNDGNGYAPYNLLIFDGINMFYSNNKASEKLLAPGTYAISNAPIGTRWPKVRFAESMVTSALTSTTPEDDLFEMLENQNLQNSKEDSFSYDDRQSRTFIKNKMFGTRSSTVVIISGEGEVRFIERRYSPDGIRLEENQHQFNLGS
jgi:uncharacterized protein with NRDE domain